MDMVEFGRTGLRVFPVGFGGIPVQRLTPDDAVATIRACLDMGVNCIDTAHGYGHSEEVIGRAIAGRRDSLVLATKSPARDAETFAAHMEQSFTRLGTDYIDIYQFHNLKQPEEMERILAPGGAMEAARAAKAAGRIGHIGATFHKLDLAVEGARSGLFESIMFPFNYITREPAEELIPLCRERGIGFFTMKPLGGGLLEQAGPCFRYLNQIPGILPIPGIADPAEMREIIGIVESGASLNADDEAVIERLRAELGPRFCRGCDYCQPCPQNIPISTVLRLRSHYRRFGDERFYGPRTSGEVDLARNCEDCGQCEQRCPFDLPVRTLLRELTAWYDEKMALYKAGKTS